MKKETKEAIYMLLDILESLSKTSKTDPSFINIDSRKLADIKNELYILISQSQLQVGSKKPELIGMLPSVLIDKNRFPTNEDIVKLANKSLNLEISRWDKRSREELIGIVISKIASKNDVDLVNFFEAWKEFINEDRALKYKETNDSFVNTWLEFFNHYKGR